MKYASTCVLADERCLRHHVPAGFPERPERVAAVRGWLEQRGWVVVEQAVTLQAVVALTPAASLLRSQSQELALEVHDRRYLERFRKAALGGAPLLDTADNPLVAGTWDAAWAALETCLSAADWMLEAKGRKGFALVRPPGHHAERDRAMGFCFLNHVAIVAHGLRQSGLGRVAIVDFDVHHGNGTQHLFEERDDVFYASLHQWPFYPGTGAARERGRGVGDGATLNLPLPAGTGDDGYRRAFEECLLPALDDYAPDGLLVSAGFDAFVGDPLGGMAVTLEGFRCFGRLLGDLAGLRCQGRVFGLLEGGYALAALPGLVEAYLEGLEEAGAPSSANGVYHSLR